MPTFTRDGQVNFSVSDIRDAGADGVIAPDDAERLIHWLGGRPTDETGDAAPETTKGFNLVTVAYYFGAMLMISACAWFLGDKWDSLGSAGVLATCLVYFAVASGLGWWLRGRGYKVGGGLLITVAVCLTPLIVFCIEDLTGFRPGIRETNDPTKYKDFYPYIRSAWILMELATMAVTLIALIRVRFGFLTDAACVLTVVLFDGHRGLVSRKRSSGLEHRSLDRRAHRRAVTILAGYAFDRTLNKPEEKSEDFAFWCYLFGLMAFWGGLTSIDSDSETGKFIYFLVNIGLAAVSLYLRRSVFLVFGSNRNICLHRPSCLRGVQGLGVVPVRNYSAWSWRHCRYNSRRSIFAAL